MSTAQLSGIDVDATEIARQVLRPNQYMIAIGVWLAALLSAGCPASEDDRFGAAGSFFAPVGGVALAAQQDWQGPSRAADSRSLVAPRAADEVRKLPDSKIRLDVVLELHDGELPVHGVRVRVDDQQVVLEGVVPSREVRDRVELVARETKGVRGVANELELADSAAQTN